MPISEARKKANAKYNQKAYDRLEVKVKKGKKEEIREFAEAQGESLNAFINRAIAEAMGKSGRKQPANEKRRNDISVELL